MQVIEKKKKIDGDFLYVGCASSKYWNWCMAKMTEKLWNDE